MPKHQLPPQLLAPHLLQLAGPSFLRPQGSEAGEDAGNMGTVETCSAYVGAPVGRLRENEGDESSRDKKEKVWREARSGEKDGPSGQKGNGGSSEC